MRKVNYTEYNAVASTEENADLVDLAAGRYFSPHEPAGWQPGKDGFPALQIPRKADAIRLCRVSGVHESH